MKESSTKAIVNFILVMLIFSSITFGEEKTRTGISDDEREKKSQSLKPETTNIAQRTLLQIENGAGINYKSFYPTYGAASPGAGFMPGFRYWKPHLFGSRSAIQISAAYSTKSYQQYQFQFGSILQKGPEPFIGIGDTGGLSAFRGSHKQTSDTFLYADLRYTRSPQEDFYGLGSDSEVTNRTDYGEEEASFDGVFGYHFEKYMVVGLRLGYLTTNIFPGTDNRFPNAETQFGPLGAPGIFNQPDFIRGAGSIFLDYRDNPGHPHNGGMYGFGFARYDDVNQSRLQFNRYTVDLRQYLPLGSSQRMLVGRFLTIINTTPPGNAVPFYFLDSLGGNFLLRGFREFRFRDKNLVYLSAEYRWEGNHGVEFAFFYDAGKVFHETSDFSLNKLETSEGFGLRFKTPESTLLRFEIAHRDRKSVV